MFQFTESHFYEFFTPFCVIAIFCVSYYAAGEGGGLGKLVIPAVERTFPIVGNYFDLVASSRLSSLDLFARLYGKIFEVYSFSQRYVVISDRELIEEALSKRPGEFCKSRFLDQDGQNKDGSYEAEALRRAVGHNFPHISLVDLSNALREIIKDYETQLDRASVAAINADPAVTSGTASLNVDWKTETLYIAAHMVKYHVFGTCLQTNGELHQYIEQRSVAGLSHDLDTVSRFRAAASDAFSCWLPTWCLPSSRNCRRSNLVAKAASDRLSEMLLSEVCLQRAKSYTKSSSADDTGGIVVRNTMKQSYLSSSSLLGTLLSSSEENSLCSDTGIVAFLKSHLLHSVIPLSIVISWAVYFLLQDEGLLNELRVEIDSFFQQAESLRLSPAPTIGHNSSRRSITKSKVSRGSTSNDNSTSSSSGGGSGSEKLFADRFATLVRTDLPLCSAVWREAIRLKSPVSAIQLETSSVKHYSKLSNGAILRPKDQLYLRIDAVLWDEEVFLEAEKFQPHRWLGRGVADMKQLQAMNKSFALAFGSGPKACPCGVPVGAAGTLSKAIGSGSSEAALMEHGALILAYLAGNFDFKLSSNSNSSSPSAVAAEKFSIDRQATTGIYAEPDSMSLLLQRRTTERAI